MKLFLVWVFKIKRALKIKLSLTSAIREAGVVLQLYDTPVDCSYFRRLLVLCVGAIFDGQHSLEAN